MNFVAKLCLAGSLSLALLPAATIYNGTGGAVPVFDRHATFDGITDYEALDVYIEDSIQVSSPGSSAYVSFTPAPGFTGSFFYPLSAQSSLFEITATDGGRMSGIEFQVGSGWSYYTGPVVRVNYELIRDTVSVASGFVDVDTTNGGTLGFRDSNGFDSVRVASYQTPQAAFQSTGNALALDNLLVDLHEETALTPAPEPATWMMTFGAAVFLLSRRSQRI